MQVYRSVGYRLPVAILQRGYSNDSSDKSPKPNPPEASKFGSPFESKFEDFKDKLLYKIRGGDTARAMDSKIYRVTPQ